MFTSVKKNANIPLEEEAMKSLMESVPITKFNRGKAGQIFGEIKKNDEIRVVVKNNEPEVVIMSPAQYNSIVASLEEYREYQLYKKVAARIASQEIGGKTYTEEEIMQKFGITEEDIANAPDDIE